MELSQGKSHLEDHFVKTELHIRAEQIYRLNVSIEAYKTEIENLEYKLKKTGSLKGLNRARARGALQSSIIRVKGSLANSTRARDSLEGDIRQMYRAACSVPRVKKISLTEDPNNPPCLIIVTDALFGCRMRPIFGKTWHRVGPMRIYVPFRDEKPDDIMKRIRYEAIEGAHEFREWSAPFFWDHLKQHAPTVLRGDGTVMCWGDHASYDLSGFLMKRNWPAVVSLLVRFAECTGQYNYLKYWPRARSRHVPQWYKDNFP